MDIGNVIKTIIAEPIDANCYTMPDGECVSTEPCMHDSPQEVPVDTRQPIGA